ncbi:MAG: hypothetical protein HY581_12805 [Nitrospirae bacterium]|nr:hypothetical protein [Nitrospirota bacterium]
MRCQRCHGLMVVDSFMDLADDTGHLWLRAWRCVNCGEVVEPGITRHRVAQRSRFARLVERLTRRAPRSPEVVPLGV